MTDRPRPPRARRGFALAVTLGALAVVGALAAALHYAAVQEQRAARYAVAGERALAAAESALALVPSWWPARDVAAWPSGRGARRLVALGGPDSAAVRLTRAGARSAWAVAEGWSGSGRARARRVAAVLFALDTAASGLLAPVTQRGGVQTF